MSKILRQSIVPIAAIVGVQAVNLVLSPPRPVQSSSCLQWANEAIDAAREALPHAEPPRVAEDGYYDVRQHREVEIPRSTATPTNHADASDPSTLGTQAATAVANPTALLPDGMTEAQYQAKRVEISADRSMVLGGY